MNILLACEESQRVCEAFRKKGHNAFSCDIIDCSGGHPEWHIQGDYIKKHFPDLCEKYDLPKKPTQIIQPWMFGDNFNKKTCLWIKGVKPLKLLVTVEPPLEYFEWTDKNGKKKRQPKWYYEALSLPPAERAKVRSKTFPGIANAMAEQWG